MEIMLLKHPIIIHRYQTHFIILAILESFCPSQCMLKICKLIFKHIYRVTKKISDPPLGVRIATTSN